MEKSGVCMIKDYYTSTFIIEAPSTTKNALGAWNPTWSTLGTITGFMDYLTGQDTQVAAQFIDKATHIIGCSSTCTWITNNHRVLNAAGLYFRVLHVDNPVLRNHHMEILVGYNESDNLST